MVKVVATIKVEFEVEENDKDLIKESLQDRLELMVEDDELMDNTKMKITDLEDDDDDEPDFEDDED